MSGIHPIIRTGTASLVRTLGPHLLGLLARKIEGSGRKKRTYKRRPVGGRVLIHRPRRSIGVGYRRRTIVHRKRPIRHTAVRGSAWQLSTTRASGTRRHVHRRVGGRTHVRRARAIYI